MLFGEHNGRAKWGLAVLIICLAALTESGISGAAAADNFPSFAPERDVQAENRAVFGAAAGKKDSASAAGREVPSSGRHLNFTARGRGEEIPAAGDAAGKNTRKMPKNPFWTYLPVLLLVVCLGCWLLLLFLKRWGSGGKSLFNSPALEIIGRTQVDRQKYFVLLRAGKRVLVVGVNANGFDALGEISDPAEVADLMVEARPQNRSGKNIFLDLFKKHVANEPDAAALPPAAAPQTGMALPVNDSAKHGQDAALSAITENLRRLRQGEQ